MLRVLDVTQEQLDAREVGGLEALFAEVEENPERVRMLKGNMGFRFPDHDERGAAVWFDPVICAWGKVAHERIPHLPYYLYPDPPVGGLLFLVSSLSSSGSLDGSAGEASDDDGVDLLALVPYLVETAKFAERMADDWRQILADLTARLEPSVRAATVAAVEATMGSARGSR
jgi:hypothetical protein